MTSASSNQKIKPISVADSKLSVFFFVAYIFQGFACAQFGFVGQPVQYFFMDGLHLNAGEISRLMSIMMIPWIIKPLYGMISDSIPFFGYRRKSYLVLVSLTSSIAFLAMSQYYFLESILCSLLVAATCMAVSTALMVALAVENGRVDGKTNEYFRIQEGGYYLTNIFVVIGAGYLCNVAAPQNALQTASLIASTCALLLSLLTILYLRETRVSFKSEKLSKKFKTIFASINSPNLRYVIFLTCLWFFSLSFGVSLYVHESKTLLFNQSFIGQLSAWTAVGTLIGAICFRKLSSTLTNKSQSLLGSALLISSTLGYCFLSTPLSAITLEIFHGFSNMFAVLTIYGLASKCCKEGAEASTMSLIVSVLNLSTCLAIFIGGQLYTHLLNNNYLSLVLLASIPPALSLWLIKKSQLTFE